MSSHSLFQTLSESEERFAQYSSDILLEFDQDFRVSYANEIVTGLWSIPRDKLIGKTLHKLNLPEEQMMFWEGSILATLDKGKAVRSRLIQHVEDREIIWSCEFHPHKSSDGNYDRIICFARDITESVRLMDELRERERNYRLLVENQSDMIVRVDTDGCFQFVSPSYCETFGKTEEELLGKPFIPLVHEDDRKITEEAMLKLYEPPHHVYVEQRAKTKAGWKWLAWADTAILDDEGNVESIIGVGQDIDERKRYQDLLAARFELNELIANSTIDELLTRAVDIAEELLESNIGFIHFYNEEKETIKLNRWSTKTITGFCSIDASGTHYPLSKAGIWGDCIRERRAVIHNDYATAPDRKGLPEGHAPLIREITVPVIRNDKIVAVIGVGNKEYEYTELDLDILIKYSDFLWDVVERHTVELRFNTLFSRTSDGVWIIDERGIIQDVNDAYCRMSGYSHDEIAGSPISKFVGVETPEETRSRMDSMIQAGSIRFESSHIGKDGKEFHIEIFASLLQKDPVSVISFMHDITEKKSIYKNMIENKNRFKALSSASFEGILFFIDGKCVDQNETAEVMFGYSLEETVGKQCTDWIVAEDRDIMLEKMSNNTREPFEVNAMRKDGSVFPCEIQMRSSMYKDQQVQVTAIRNITERKKAEVAVRESEEKLRSVIEQSNDAIYIYINNNIDMVNNRFAEITGIPVEKALDPAFDLFEFIERAEVPDIDQKLHATRSPEDKLDYYAFVLTRADGAKLQIQATVKGIHYQEDVALLVVLRDVTLQKQLEEQYRQSQKMESIGLLAGGIAHDFNNLLSPIMGNAEIAMMRIKPDQPYYEEFSEIYAAAEKAKGLVGQLLAFSRNQKLEFSNVAVNELIHGMKKILRRTIREDIHLKYELCKEEVHVYADPLQIEQVLLNICINAQDAMKGGGEIRISTRVTELDEVERLSRPSLRPGSYMLLRIEDTGHGMDSETADRIFDPFFTTKEVGKGTGLGLSTVHGIVEQHNGMIKVESVVNKGTAFNVYLPHIPVQTEKKEV